MVTVVIADESELAANSSEIKEQTHINMTNEGNISSNSTISNGSSLGNGTIAGNLNQTSQDNISISSETLQNEEIKEKKPVYTLSIGSVYSSDYTEPQPRTFTSSGC